MVNFYNIHVFNKSKLDSLILSTKINIDKV